MNRNNYLLLSETIKKYSSKEDTLGMSGFMHAVYPQTGLFPPSDKLSNLNLEAIKASYNPIILSQLIKMESPKFIFGEFALQRNTLKIS